MSDVNDMYEDLLDFHTVFDATINYSPVIPDRSTQMLRKELISKEFTELINALNRQDLVEIADGCVDLIYVVIGTMVSYGLPLNLLWEEVHKSNMGETFPGANGEPIIVRSQSGKVVKPEGWCGPQIKRILKDCGGEV